MAQDTRLRDIRHWQAGSGMNLDDDARTLKPNEHREILNSIIAVSESNHASCLENIKGTVNVFDLPVNANLDPPAGLRAIGSCEDVKDNAVIFHLRDTTGDDNHAILRYHNSDSRCEWILKNEPLLNYQDGYPVFSNRIGDLIYWTDGYFGSFLNNDFNPPHKLNIVRAMGYTNPFSMVGSYVTGEYVGYEGKVYQCLQDATGVFITDTDYWVVADNFCYTQVVEETLSRAKRPPLYPPSVSYSTDTDYKMNGVRGNLFQFCYRFIYDDYEKSVFSSRSDVPLPSNIELLNGSYLPGIYTDNRITVTVNTGIEQVRIIEVAVRVGNTGIWSIFKTIRKFDADGNRITDMDDDVDIDVYFYGNEVGVPVDQEKAEKPFDFVPQVSALQDLIEKNRLCDARYRDGYDNIDIDVSLSVQSEDADVGTIGGTLNNTRTEFKVYRDGHPYTYQAVKIDFTSFYQPGFTYYINISAYPKRYMNSGTLSNFCTDYLNKDINGTAFIDVPLGTSFETFINTVVAQLRTTVGSSKLVAVNNFDYKTFCEGGTVLNLTPSTGVFLDNNMLGVIIDSLDAVYEPINNVLPYLSIKITKITGRSVLQSFKSGAFHNFGLVYFDDYDRRGYANISDGSKVYVPAQNETPQHGLLKYQIAWNIDHTPPLWAKSYQWVYAKNTSISYCLYASVAAIEAAPTSGCLFVSVNKYITETSEDLPNFRVPAYQWEKGDRVRFVFINSETSSVNYATPDTYLDFEVLGAISPAQTDQVDTYLKDDTGDYILDADGNKIKDPRLSGFLINDFNYHQYNIGADNTIVEIYRPKKTTETLVYYSYGDKYDILYPHTENRVHSQTQGVFIKGDVFLTLREMHNIFPVERFDFSDFYSSDAIWIGFPNAENVNAASKWFPTNISYSGVYIENTLVNGLSEGSYTDFITMPQRFGDINFIKEVGFTLKVIQKYKPSSIYIGRQGLTQADVSRGEVLYASNNTLGTVTINPNSSYGTQHPLSCFLHEGNLYGYCINSGVIWRDSGNGIRSISQPEEGDTDQSMYKVKILTQTKSQIFASHDVQVFTAYDGRYDIVYFCFVDATDTAESYTIGFHEPSNCWVSFYSFIPEFITAMKMTTLSWKSSSLWLHNEGTRMNFYGVQYAQYVKTVSNIQPLLKKRFLALTENASGVWHLGMQGDVYIPPDETYKRGQTSLIKAGAFRDIEGTIYAPFGKNMTTHQLLPTNDDYLNGDDMRGNFIELTLRNSDTDETNLFSIEVDSVVSNP